MIVQFVPQHKRVAHLVQLFASPSSLFLTTVLNKLYTNREMLWLQNELLCSSKTRSCIMVRCGMSDLAG